MYDSVGNVKQITNSVASETNTYEYDSLNRLTSWTLNDQTKTYGYNNEGNLSSKEGVILNYNDASHVHAVTGAGSNTYQYDLNGNQTTRMIGNDTFDLSYDAENRLVEVKKNNTTIAQFTYDGNGRRVKSIVNGETVLFVGTYFEQDITASPAKITKYYLAGASRIAMRKYTIPQNMNVEYTLGDHLGSTSITTDTLGNKVSELRYTPWGEIRYSWTEPTLMTAPDYELSRYTFTDQYSYMEDFELMFYNARFFDPYLNRFTQPDSIVPLVSQGTQALDRYAYANNNPVRYSDPTGHKACDEFEDQGTCDPLERLLNFIDGSVVGKTNNSLRAMIRIVARAAQIYGSDWNSFLSATNFVFIGVYENGPFSQVHAQQSSYKGYLFSSSGFSFHFNDGDNQVRHFWGAFATAASTNGELPFGPYWTIPNSTIAKGGNFVHDLMSDWRGDKDTTVYDFSLSQEAIAMGKDVASGRIASPSDLPTIMQETLSSGSWYYVANNYLLQWLWLTPYE